MIALCSYCRHPLAQKTPSPSPYCRPGCVVAAALESKCPVALRRTRVILWLAALFLAASLIFLALRRLSPQLELASEALALLSLVFLLPLWMRDGRPRTSTQPVLIALFSLVIAATLARALHFPASVRLPYLPWASVLACFEIFKLHRLAKKRAQLPSPLDDLLKEWPQAADLKPGDTVQIQPGERFPADGIIRSGTSGLDISLLTRENTPIYVSPGDIIPQGALNRDLPLTVEILKSSSDSALAQHVQIHARLLQEAAAAVPAHAQWLRWIIGLVAITLPTLLILLYFIPYSTIWVPFFLPRLGALLLILPWLSDLENHEMISRRTLADLAKTGVLIQNSTALTKLPRISTLYFEKTGTLTRGRFHFAQLFTEYGTSEELVLSAFFTLERHARHPLARGVETHPWYGELAPLRVSHISEQPGLGVSGTLHSLGSPGTFAAVGNLRFLKRLQMHVTREMRAKIDDLEAMGESVILCGFRGQVRGLMSLVDEIRPQVRGTLAAIKEYGIEPAIMTGDTEETLTHLTGSLDIKKIHAHCLTNEKIEKLRRGKDLGLTIGMVGRFDEGTDMLTAAGVSFTLESGPWPAAADVLMPGSDFTTIAKVFAITRAARTHQHQLRRFWILGLMGAVLISATGLLPAWLMPLLGLAYSSSVSIRTE